MSGKVIKPMGLELTFLNEVYIKNLPNASFEAKKLPFGMEWPYSCVQERGAKESAENMRVLFFKMLICCNIPYHAYF